ncbi:MAG: helix-turn-helix transcriptional regulator [Candidatus Brocadiia bacterium]
MEFITQKKRRRGESQFCLSDWLRAMIASLATFSPDRVIWPRRKERFAEPVKNTVSAAQRHTSSLHSHDYTELCVSVGGRALMEVSDDVYALYPPSIFFALPKTPHCQAHRMDSAWHALVWLAFSQDAMLVVTSLYEPERGWAASRRISLEGQDVRQSSEILSELTADQNQIPLNLIRANLLTLANRVYQQAARQELSNEEPQSGLIEHHLPVLNYIRTYINNNLDKKISLQELGEMARLSPNYLNRLFKDWAGQPIHQYKVRRRMETAMQLLREGELLIKQVARKVGYEDPLYFSRAFHDYFGRWPSDI